MVCLRTLFCLKVHWCASVYSQVTRRLHLRFLHMLQFSSARKQNNTRASLSHHHGSLCSSHGVLHSSSSTHSSGPSVCKALVLFLGSTEQNPQRILCGLFIWFWAYWSCLLSGFWVSRGVCLGVQAWIACSHQLLLQVFCHHLGFLTTCLS